MSASLMKCNNECEFNIKAGTKFLDRIRILLLYIQY